MEERRTEKRMRNKVNGDYFCDKIVYFLFPCFLNVSIILIFYNSHMLPKNIACLEKRLEVKNHFL
jgi:hypothetical protein